ncbi:MAG: DUF4375 domain-containing protein [Sphingobacteriales bacterium]|nr:MAG: DUF4375 domain-containing protein [Sphingobacteriales bacterium]
MSFANDQYPVQNLPAHLKLVQERLDKGKPEDAFEVLTAPLHGELYTRQDFSWTDTLPELLRVGLYFDYVRMQVLQGGFLQLVANHYVSLLLPLPEWMKRHGQEEMAQVFDDVLKVYVLNREYLGKETTVEEFAKLYEQFPEMAQFDSRFEAAYPEALAVLVKVLLEALQS